MNLDQASLKARVALKDHLQSKGDIMGLSLADEAFRMTDYRSGEIQEAYRNARRYVEDLTKPRGIVGPGFSVKFSNGQLTHTITGKSE